MAKNKALKKLRGILEGMPCGGDLAELLDNAVAHERERPEVQAAEHQARLAKARADLAEWRVAECRPDTWQGSLARKAHAEAELAALRVAERCGLVDPAAERRRIIRENGETIASIPETVVQAPEPADAKQRVEQLRAAEERGFYQGRNQAWRLLMETQARHPDTIKVSKAFLADLQRAILYMQKEG